MKAPRIAESAFIAENARVIGDVEIGEESSVWYGAIVRGDENSIRIGKGTNIQDNCVVHVSQKESTSIGDNVTVGHGAIIHAAVVEDTCLIGMNAVVLNRAVVGKGSIVGAGAVVTQDTKIPEGSLVLGVPAKVIKSGDDSLIEGILKNAEIYKQLAREHLSNRYSVHRD